MRILLAEDNTVNQRVAVALLKKLGFYADVVANGADALRSLEHVPYDLVLMDVSMPLMDGLETTRIIRDPHSAVLNHRIPIIAMTANAMHGDREACLEAGMDDYVTKPISPKALADALGRQLPHEHGAPNLPESDAVQSPPARSSHKHAAMVFDKEGLLTRLMDDEKLAAKVARIFLEDLPTQIDRLKTFLRNGDASCAERQLHTIKSACANMGGEALSAVASKMENACKTGDLTLSLASLPDLEDQFAYLKTAVEQVFFIS